MGSFSQTNIIRAMLSADTSVSRDKLLGFYLAGWKAQNYSEQSTLDSYTYGPSSS